MNEKTKTLFQAHLGSLHPGRERVKAGVAHARPKGKRLGRRPLIDEKLLRTARDRRDKGISIRGISKELGVSKSLVPKIPSNLGVKSFVFSRGEIIKIGVPNSYVLWTKARKSNRRKE